MGCDNVGLVILLGCVYGLWVVCGFVVVVGSGFITSCECGGGGLWG